MNHYSPMSRSERAAVAVVSSTVSLSLVAGLLVLFNDGRLPWPGSDLPSMLADAGGGDVHLAAASCPPPQLAELPGRAGVNAGRHPISDAVTASVSSQ